MKIVILGSTGRLGRQLVQTFEQANCDVCALSKRQVNLLKAPEVDTMLGFQKPDWVINATGWTDVEQAENHREEAFALNALAVGYLAKQCAQRDVRLLQFSSDYVFGDAGSEPHYEEDALDPHGVYAQSKAMGETLVGESGVRGLIVRAGWLHQGENDFVESILGSLLHGKPLSLTDSQWGKPSSIQGLATWVFDLLMTQATIDTCDIRHYVEAGPFITPLDWARVLVKLANQKKSSDMLPQGFSEALIEPRSSLELFRPKNCRLATHYAHPLTQSWLSAVEKSVEHFMARAGICG